MKTKEEKASGTKLQEFFPLGFSFSDHNKSPRRGRNKSHWIYELQNHVQKSGQKEKVISISILQSQIWDFS